MNYQKVDYGLMWYTSFEIILNFYQPCRPTVDFVINHINVKQLLMENLILINQLLLNAFNLKLEILQSLGAVL